MLIKTGQVLRPTQQIWSFVLVPILGFGQGFVG